MPIRFLLDECLRDKKLWISIEEHNKNHPKERIEAIRVGDDGAPQLGSEDREVVEWAATTGWLIFSNDVNTLRKEHDEFVREGNHTCGLLLRRVGFSIDEIIECLMLIAHDSTPDEWTNRTEFIPF